MLPHPAAAQIPWPEASARAKEENARLAARPGGHDGTYFVVCTLYYTPVEAGFTAERGFNMTMETRPGLRGRKYPVDFLRAVRLEGYGKITTPVNGRGYIAYAGPGRYMFDTAPKGRGITPLIPRHSAAVKLGDRALKGKMRLSLTSPEVEEVFGSTEWKIIDTGGGLRRWQLDLYWGEDEPRGPDSLGRPRGTDFEYGYAEVKISTEPPKEQDKKKQENTDG
ncbi:hypothetical protein BH20VER1_BH20VER1_17120 [soil metagenome]